MARVTLLGCVLVASCDKSKDPPPRCMEYQTFSIERAQSKAATSTDVLNQGIELDTFSWTVHHVRMVLGVEGVLEQDFDPVHLCSNVDKRIRSVPGNYSKEFARHDMICAEGLLEAGQYDRALHHLVRTDSVTENDPTFGSDSFDREWARPSRDALHSILAYSLGNCQETVEKLLTSQFCPLPILQLCLREVHSPSEILEELDRSVDRVVVGSFQQAPVPIQKSLRSHGVTQGPRVFAWTTVFGMPHLLPFPNLRDTNLSREDYIDKYKTDGLYHRMYCLPDTEDSLALIRHGGPR